MSIDKRIAMISLFVMIIVFISNGCKKYPEGPKFSLRSINSRLEGRWEMIRYDIDDIDSLSIVKYKKFVIDKVRKTEEYRSMIPLDNSNEIAYVKFYENNDLLAIKGDETLLGNDFVTRDFSYLDRKVFGDTVYSSGYRILKLTNRELKIRSFTTALHQIVIEFKRL